jgi:hypothetical protein
MFSTGGCVSGGICGSDRTLPPVLPLMAMQSSALRMKQRSTLTDTL